MLSAVSKLGSYGFVEEHARGEYPLVYENCVQFFWKCPITLEGQTKKKIKSKLALTNSKHCVKFVEI